jgi:hypothetical protein
MINTHLRRRCAPLDRRCWSHLRRRVVSTVPAERVTDLAITLWARQTIHTTARVRRGLGLVAGESPEPNDTSVRPVEAGRRPTAAPAVQTRGVA